MSTIHKLLLPLTIFSIAVFILTASFGLNFSMTKDKTGSMSHCPLMNDKSTRLCNMGMGDHFARWQQLFTAAILSDTMLFFAVLATTAFFVFRIRRTKQLSVSYLYLYRYYLNRHKESILYNDLQQALSRGVLHPKLYT